MPALFAVLVALWLSPGAAGSGSPFAPLIPGQAAGAEKRGWPPVQTVEASEPAQRPWLNASLPVERRLDLLLAQMTTAEKVAQMLSAHVHNDTGELFRVFGKTGWGVACLPPKGASKNATRDQILAWRNDLQARMMSDSRLGIPVSFRAELLHSGALPGSVVFPMPCSIGATWNRSLAEAIASAAAADARAGGVDYGFGPVLQVATDARWGRLCEAYGEDPTLVTELGMAAVRGYQGPPGATDTYVTAPKKLPMQAKHFAMYGAISHDTLPVDRGLATLHDVYLRPWRVFVQRGGGRSVMASHPPVRQVPAVANRWLLTKILREEWGAAEVTVASDDGDVSQLTRGWRSTASDRDAARLAVLAGLDQELHSGADPHGLCFTELANTTKEEDPSVFAAVNRAARNALRIKFASGLFDRPAHATAGAVNRTGHRQLALSAARQGCVLLLNRNGTLPMSALAGGQGLKSVAVLGPISDGLDAELAMTGGYAAHTAPGSVQTVAAAVLQEVLPGGATVSVRRGASVCNGTYPAGKVAESVAAAALADLALVVLGDSGGVNCTTCGEGRDRNDLDLPGTQLQLLRGVLDGVDPARTKVVVVLVHGRPATFGSNGACGRLDPCHNGLLDHPALAAVVAAWRPGQFGAAAVLDLLTGRHPFVGKLTQAWPRSVGQIGAAGVGPWFGMPLRQGAGLTSDAYASGLKTPLFPFGYGLQPGAQFRFLNMSVDRPPHSGDDWVNVSVTVRNDGAVRSAATVQLYYSPPVAPFGILRLARRLVTFERVWVAAGETTVARMGFNGTEALSRYDEMGPEWDAALAPAFVLDAGWYTLHAGDCCVSGVVADTTGCHLPLTSTFYVPESRRWR